MRRCGDCTACCTVLGVVSIKKSPGVTCAHMRPNGCEIYDTRPDDCATWSCLYISDGGYKKKERLLSDKERPDRVGVMFDCDPFARILAHELWPGAFKQSAKLMDRVARNQTMLRLVFDG